MEIATSLLLLVLNTKSLASGTTIEETINIEQWISDSPSTMTTDKMNNTKENRRTLITLLNEGRIDEFEKSIKGMPGLKERTENGAYADVMAYTIALNELNLSKWLNENCADCNLKNSGYAVVDFMGRTYEGKAWQSMNADTFKFVYENGGVTAYLESQPERSIFVHVADHWIPEGDSGYGDYTITDDDIRYEQKRREQKLEMLRFLLTKGHSVNEVEKISNSTAMFKAVQAQDDALVDFLVASGANASVGRNPLATITHRVEPGFLQKILDFGFDPNEVTPPFYSSPSATTLLGRIVQGGEFKPELLAVLELHQIDFELVDSHGLQPIDYAYLEFDQAEQPYTDYLKSKGAKISDQYYYSTLVNAIQRNKHDVMKQVLSTHPHLANGLKEDEKVYPLERALRSGSTDNFKLLIDAGAEMHDRDYYSTALFEGAISRKNYELAQVILDAHPSLPVNRAYKTGEKEYLASNALAEASSAGNLEWVNKLLELGASLESGGFFGYPIVGPALNGHFDVVKALLDAGSTTNPIDDKGKSLIDMLEEEKMVEMVDYLKSYGK